jgi:hypothetical protein
MAVALVSAALFGVIGQGPASGQVTAVRGSAFGFRVFNLSLFGGAQPDFGPAPTVTLPATGSATPMTATAASADASVTPARFFTSGQLDVSTQGTPAGGAVTSTARVANINTSQQEILTAGAIESPCTANSTGVSGGTTITGGSLQTDSGLDRNNDGDYTDAGEHAPVSQALPANPGANTEYTGHIHLSETSQDTFRVVFNEQVINADGSITVNAVHEYLLGPVAKGEVIVGQVVCGLTGTAVTTTSTTTGASTTSTTAGATTTSTTAGATTTTTAATTTTTTTAATTTTSATTTTTSAAAGTSLGGGAYGYFTSVGLFGGAAATRGPEPSVTLPAAGADPPLTATLPSARAAYGPAEIFTSGKIDVSTQGTAGPSGSARSSATLADVGPGPFVAQSLSSTCTASSTGRTGSVTVAGGKVTTSEGANLDSEADDTIVNVASNPAPNTSIEGKLESIGDSFRIVLNEQTTSGGSITVNAVHMYLLGPTAVGEAIIGQSRCGATATTGSGGGGSGTVTASGGGIVRTGTEAATLVAFALVLAVGGSTFTYWSQGLRDRRKGRPMPWSRHRVIG